MRFPVNPKYRKSKDNPCPEFLLIWENSKGRECSAQYTRKDEAEERLGELIANGVCNIKLEKRYFAGYISLR